MTTLDDAKAFFSDYVFIDAETTGLDPTEHDLLEFTYAVGLEEPKTLYVDGITDVLKHAHPLALQANKYLERFASVDDEGQWVDVPEGMGDPEHTLLSGFDARWLNLPGGSSQEDFNAFVKAVEGKYWVGARPEFDLDFIKRFFYPEPLKYKRALDLCAWVAGRIEVPRPLSFSEELSQYAITKPDHTSYNDVKALRECFIGWCSPQHFTDIALTEVGVLNSTGYIFPKHWR